jgi:uncharacterized protein YegP (UPF0339 family)
MLHKQFLNDNDKHYLLNIALNLDYLDIATGYNAKLNYLKNIKNDLFLDIITKNHNYKFDYNKSFFVRINNFGYISVHTDEKIINLNILLQKPKEGGFILHGNNKVIMQEKDMYLLDTSIKHGISTIKSNDEYYSLVLWDCK